eukprot:CAMPEP_0206049622 /NCGR_PEP_ID=MMETSP1466-20131121/27228_1 /ASSEMBLY_ACC=CAM_ASM_001126 /TAXON_ID=44452 /ORGANISM="Pavlova gyrans, Strain CCMP608" /LENGTH=128 /DNA_ID=CAMNT_0053424713 /DNA_START=681 /DNA_END=1067 /DNA_ORIENTATION=-
MVPRAGTALLGRSLGGLELEDDVRALEFLVVALNCVNDRIECPLAAVEHLALVLCTLDAHCSDAHKVVPDGDFARPLRVSTGYETDYGHPPLGVTVLLKVDAQGLLQRELVHPFRESPVPAGWPIRRG